MSSIPASTSAPRVESVEVTVRLADGTVKTLTMTAPREVTVDLKYGDDESWDWSPSRMVGRQIETVTVEIDFPREVEERTSA